jgi:hypothetical protein
MLYGLMNFEEAIMEGLSDTDNKTTKQNNTKKSVRNITRGLAEIRDSMKETDGAAVGVDILGF